MIKIDATNCKKEYEKSFVKLIPLNNNYSIKIINDNNNGFYVNILTSNRIQVEINNDIINYCDNVNDLDLYIDKNVKHIIIKSINNNLNCSDNLDSIIIKKSTNNIHIEKIEEESQLQINKIIHKMYNHVKNNNNNNKDKNYEDFTNYYLNYVNEFKNKYDIEIEDCNFKKILVILAAHTIDNLKFMTIINNIKYFNKFEIIIINSSGTLFSKNLSNYCGVKKIKYFEIPNDCRGDVGKWMHVLNNFDYKEYENILFTNDSILISNHINFYFNIIINTEKELYGYNDSTETGDYHYQSYLFSIKSKCVNVFMNYYEKIKNELKSWSDLIHKIEKKIITLYANHDCFLKIAYLYYHKGININFSDDTLFVKLINLNLLPILKIKRIRMLI